MRLGIDLDGVLYDFAPNLHRWLVTEGRVAADSDPNGDGTWHMYRAWGMTETDFERHCCDAVDAGVLFKGPIIDGAASAMDLLHEAGHELHIVTARDYGARGRAEVNTRVWLAEHRIPFDSLTFSHDKSVVPVDLFVEDNPGNFELLWGCGTTTFLIDRPWNQHVEAGRWRVPSFEAFAAEVLRFPYCARCGRHAHLACACGMTFLEKARSVSLTLPKSFRAAS